MLSTAQMRSHLFFFIRPCPDVANADKAAGKLRRYKIIFTPQKVRPALSVCRDSACLFAIQLLMFTCCVAQFYACEAVLEEQGMFGGK